MQMITSVKMKKQGYMREVEIDINAACNSDGEILYADITGVKDLNSEKLLSVKDIENIEDIEDEIYEFLNNNIDYLFEEYLVENYNNEQLDEIVEELWDKVN